MEKPSAAGAVPTALQALYRKRELPEKPDIIVILTDQERYPAHWGGFEETLTSWRRLKQNGLTFERAYTSACMCTPSRGVMLTSNYSNLTGLAMTPSTLSYADPRIPQLAALMQAQGYDVIWKGKWHLSSPVDVMQWSPYDIGNMKEQYGFSDWNPPDAGTVAGFSTFDSWATAGSGKPGFVNPSNDKRYLRKDGEGVEAHGFGEGALEFLEARAAGRKLKDPAAERPFLMFMSFVNPHDINFFPWGWQSLGYRAEEFEDLKIELPSNAVDSLRTKPTIQSHVRDVMNKGQPLIGQDKLTDGTDTAIPLQPDPVNTTHNYVKFYAVMTQYVDARVNEFLDVVDACGFTDNALILRTSDHGEMGLSHGMREKVYNVYEETLHIPLVISNPKLFAEPQRTQAMYAHVDFLPTLLNLAGGDASRLMKGRSLGPVILDPSSSVQDTVLFCYDDESAMISDLQYLCHIRAIRHRHFTYAVYFSPNLPGQYQYELYDLETDKAQMTNLLYQPHLADESLKSLWARLQDLLNQKLIEAGQTPFPPVR
ncbi:sulfatase-like hydrolase/transferase [Myxococcus sp. Y35]|uniref:sulfatase-like hydrolase/transferase n=1 Tax=Pseudomyxococcus flavus TaxID=3115648 RepID=UPI003CF6962A